MRRPKPTQPELTEQAASQQKRVASGLRSLSKESARWPADPSNPAWPPTWPSRPVSAPTLWRPGWRNASRDTLWMRSPASAAGRTRRRRPVRGGHRRLDHRPGPDALLPPPRPSAATAVITAACDCPVPEIVRLGRTLHTAGGVPRALRPHQRVQRADRIPEPEDQEHQAHRTRIPQLRQLPAPPTSQPRPNPEQSPDITDPNPPSQLGGVEPLLIIM